jgi:FkbH-like protein
VIESLTRPRLYDLLTTLEPDRIDFARMLTALAHLSPAECLTYLADTEEDVRESVSPQVLSEALGAALEAQVGDAPVSSRVLDAVARRYRDGLTPAAIAKLVALQPVAPPAGVVDALERGLERFPHDSHLLRCALNLAQARSDHARADALLTRLGFAENTPATTSFVYRARRQLPGADKTDVRVALLSSYTVDHLVPFLDLECRAAGLAPAVYVTPFNSWTRDVIDESSGLRAFAPDIAFLSVSIDDLIPQLSQPLQVKELEEAGTSALGRVVAVAEAYARWAGGKPLVVHSFHSPFSVGPLGILDRREAVSRAQWLEDLNVRLGAALRELSHCHLLDVQRAACEAATSLSDNPKMRHLAAMRLPPTALGAVARAYLRYIVPLKGLTKKCVVLDLDNTLWGGLAGEDGKDGIRLGHSSPGCEFIEFQQFLQQLARRGILLAINSKNNPDDALEVIRTHEAMVLREEAFSAVRINWKTKHENMTSIAEELNIGLDSMLFVDDNPDERELMRQLLPQVLTVDLPRDPALYRSTLEALPQLEVLSLTSEDQERVERYQTVRRREQARVTASSVGEYLRSLGIKVEIASADRPVYARVAQLFARTNQFNTTTRRYDGGDVERLATDPRCHLIVLESEDRFGKHGLVALALVREESGTWRIDSFLMSCRVIGYGIESALLSYICKQAQAAGADSLVGEFIPTMKNAPARDLFANHGFTAIGVANGSELWERSLCDGIPFPPWIERT